MPRVKKADADRFLAALKKQHAAYITDTCTPMLFRDWDWTGNGAADWSIVWEEGPFEWAYLFPYGGIDEEFGFTVPDVSGGLPAGLYAEAITSWAVAVYPT